jgi:hypothetical protein
MEPHVEPVIYFTPGSDGFGMRCNGLRDAEEYQRLVDQMGSKVIEKSGSL